MRAKASTASVDVSPDQRLPFCFPTPVDITAKEATDKSLCPECHQPVETVDVSEAICSDCQVVIGDPISRSSTPWYDSQDWKAKKQTAGRVTPLFPDKGIGTHENLKDRSWTKDRTQREYRLGYALGEIRRIGADFELPRSTLESAALLYRKAFNKRLVEGRSIDGFAAASLLIAIRQSSIRMPVSRREIQQSTRATPQQVRTARVVLEQKLELAVPPMDPRDFLPKATSDLSAPGGIERCARTLLNARQGDSEEVRSISPRTLAAAAIYTAYELVNCTESVTLAEISSVLGVATSTISSQKSHMLQYKDSWEA